MEGKVRLTITGIQSGFGEKDTSELITTADYFEKGEKIYIFYGEYTEERLRIQNRLTVAPDYVELKKNGNGPSVLLFRKGKKERCSYQSPMGAMELLSDTRKIAVTTREDYFCLELKYALFMGGQFMSDYELRVTARK